MRRATTVALVATVLLALTMGAAVAATIITCQGGECQGTDGDETMNGTSSSDWMHALAGNDTLNAFEGDDDLYGEDGNDTLNADLGNDSLYGQNGTDTLNGDDGNDSLFAGSGNDTLNGHGGDDRLFADGSDTFVYAYYVFFHEGVWEQVGNDTLHGGPGNDYMFGYNGGDKLYGEDGADKISALDNGDFANPGVDTVSGGPGNDSITAHDGFSDDINCGTGKKDFVYFDKALDHVQSNCERLAWPQAGQKECLPVEYPPADSPDAHLSIRDIVGTDGNEFKLLGTNHEGCLDVIESGNGNDTLWGLRGPDALEGGAGDDILHGGPGDDGLFGDRASTPIDFQNTFPVGDEGSDEIYGEEGNDWITAVDGKPDTISCGPGDADEVQADQNIDVVAKDCERVTFSTERAFGHWWRRLMQSR